MSDDRCDNHHCPKYSSGWCSANDSGCEDRTRDTHTLPPTPTPTPTREDLVDSLAVELMLRIKDLERKLSESQDREDMAHRQGINLMDRLCRMIRIALRWRRSAILWHDLDEIAVAAVRRDRAKAANAEAKLANLARSASLFDRIAAWQRETFPKATAESCSAHLAYEQNELADAVVYGDIDDTAEEAADCLLLLVGIADRSGFDLLQAAEAKLAKNRLRKWGKPDAKGVVEHVEEEIDHA